MATAISGYNTSPAPTTGQGAYGLVPGATGIPPSIWQQMQDVSGFPGMTKSATGDINSELAGTLSAGTRNTLQDAAASWGVTSGMPWTTGAGIPMSKFLSGMGLTSEGLTSTGISDYFKFLGGVGGTQTDPALASSIAQSNATLASAPDPSQAAAVQQANFDKYMAQMLQMATMQNQSPAAGSGYSITPPSSGPYGGAFSQFPGAGLGSGSLATQIYNQNVASNMPGSTSPYSVYSFGGSGQNVDFSGLSGGGDYYSY
jgi:hypothetical protein